jgi:hypothetical protein
VGNLLANRARVFVGLIFLIILGCTGGGDGGNDDASAPPLQLSTNSASFTLNAGAANLSRHIVVTLPEGTYSLAAGYSGGQSKPSWVTYSFDPVYIGRTTTNFNIGVSAHGLSRGTYTDRIHVQAKDVGGKVLAIGTVNVKLAITDPLSISLSRLDFYTADGASTVPGETIALSRVNTSGTWSASADQNWLVLSSTSGSTPFNLDVSVDVSGLAIGIYNATVSITDNLTNDTTDIPVNLYIEPHRLSVIDNGVALSSLPSRARLSHTIEIGENGGVGTAWSAESDQDWLTLSASTGTTSTSRTLTLTADPAGLPMDAIHYANVTISSSDTSIANSEIVSVGLYISSTDALSMTSISRLHQADYPSGLVSDSIRPYVYVSNMTSVISVYNVYSGALVTTIAGNFNDTFSDLEVSSNGNYLYAVNRSDSSIKRIDLSTMTFDATWIGFNFPVYTTTPSLSQMDLRYARLNGYPVLVTSGIQVLDAGDGSVLTKLNDFDTYFRPPMIALSSNGETAFVSYANDAYFDLDRYELWYSHITNSATAYLAQRRPRKSFEQAPLDMTMNRTGTRLLTVQTNSIYEHFRSYSNDQNMDFNVHENYGYNTRVNAICTGPTGNVYTARWSQGNDNIIYSYDNAFDPLSNVALSVSGIVVNRKLVTSGDGMRLILRTRDGSYDALNMMDVTP